MPNSLFVYIVHSMAKQGHIQAHLTTNTGLVREHNEDFVAFREPANQADEKQNGWIYIVADGVGGADAGEVASEFASERMLQQFLDHPEEPNWGQRLIKAMQAANIDLRQLVAERNDNSRMATTMVAAVIINENKVFIGNVGDSRGYHWRNGHIRQVTKDQSLVAKLVEEGAITEAEAHSHPRRNVILYSLGSERQPKIDLYEISLMPGDIILLCSDGLTRHVADAEISDVIGREKPKTATDTLVHMANQRGGEDNISVAVIQVGGRTSVTTKKLRKKQAEPTTGITQPSAALAPEPAGLWLYTGGLSLMLIFFIFLVWLLLRV